MRDGNVGAAVVWFRQDILLDLPMRDGNQKMYARFTREHALLDLPMRDGNKIDPSPQ